MPKTIRIRTDVGQNTAKQINVNIEQDFDFLEILSLKLLQSDVYLKQCSDYGVVVGRVLVNNGYGVPNAKISVFIPLSNEDENNPIINSIYPYKSVSDVNEDGYRYNLLPYEPSYPGHKATGTFPTREDAIIDKTVVQLYDKYYKFTVQTNDSGDFMIFGVPVGTQTLIMDVDLSDIGEFSLSPQDLIRIGLATPSQVDGTQFKTSENLNTLPQIINVVRTVEVAPFWGDPEQCQIAITRTDFDLGLEANLDIQPSAIFMGSLISTPQEQAQKRKCKVNKRAGNQCSLVSGPGQIKAIRQTIFEDSQGRPALETFNFEDDGKVIDENGTWLLDVPMNMDYITTDEFGQRIISNDPKIGIPSSAKYRFKIKWQQQPDLSEPVKRGYFLVPNIREYGWRSSDTDPSKLVFSNNILNTPQLLQFATSSTVDIVQNLGLLDPNEIGVVKIVDKTNISDYTFILNGVPIPQKDNIEVVSTDNLTVSVVLDDTSQIINLGSISYNFERYEKIQAEKSYSFSLSWDDYVDPQAAINCEDTFYEMRYNKVYTVSQLIDQYRNGFANSKFLGIKDITNENCQSTTNPFPTNDAQYKTTFLYLLFSLMILVVKPMLFSQLLYGHFAAFYLKYLIYPYAVIIAVLFLLVIGICELINAFANIFGRQINCPDFNDLRDLILDLIYLWKKMIIRLPNLTYPDCEICNCIDEDAQEYEDDPYEQQASQITKDSPSGLIYDFTNLNQYEDLESVNYICCQIDDNDNPCTTDNWENDAEICNAKVIAARASLAGVGNPPYSYGGVNVLDEEGNSPPKRGWVSTSLSIAERVNLWNAKAKFFNDTLAGEGFNRIRVSFNPTTNPITNSSLCHEDNVVIILIDRGKIDSYSPGQLISFQDATLSKDLNVISGTTGLTSLVGQQQIFVNYANSSSPNGNNLSQTYTITITGDSISKPVFPMDIEYFQVIKGYTLDEIKNLSTGNSLDSFYNRVFKQGVYLNRIDSDPTFVAFPTWDVDESLGFSSSELNGDYPYQLINDWENIGVLILNRGVDPNTPRMQVEYGLGRIFGDINPASQTVIGDYHLNIPIQNKYTCVRHHQITTNNVADSLNQKLYFPTFNSLTFQPNTFATFKSSLHQFYVNLDSTTFSQISEYVPGYEGTLEQDEWKSGKGVINLSASLGIGINNLTVAGIGAINEWGAIPTPNVIGQIYGDADTGNGIIPTIYYSRSGYLQNEKVEGCSFAHLSFWGIDKRVGGNNARAYGAQGIYNSRKYDSTIEIEIQESTSSNYVMRSDRLPTSSYSFQNGENFMALQQNTGLAIFKISDDGTFSSFGGYVGGGGYNGDDNADNVSESTNPGFVNNVLETFTCGESNSTLVPFGCYQFDSSNNSIYLDTPDCFTRNFANVEYFKNNCYQMITKPLFSLPVDFLTLFEWLSRTKVFFGLCQDVFKHMFTNSWINGTLFAFSFKNDRFFDTRYNKPYNVTCDETLYFHRPTNNFLYRSSPFDETISDGFIGRNAPEPSLFPYFGGNVKNLMFPTTMMDLGPRDNISKFLAQTNSNEYEGYVVDKLPSTSFNDVDEILNLFVMSRLASTGFLQQFFGVGGATIFNYFTREVPPPLKYYSQPYDYVIRNKNMVDSDYAQLISINSEFGIVPFDVENYSNDPNLLPNQQQTIFFDGRPDIGNGVVGIFFSSFTQNRDFISPRRIVYDENAGLNANNCNLNPLPLRDQLVPFYQWALSTKDLIGNQTSIFGNQKGHWYTVGIKNGTDVFFSSKYQSLDRLSNSSRFMRTTNQNQTNFYKGHIYSVNGAGEISGSLNTMSQDTFIDNENVITHGGPFFFYFGLNRGASAMDRFITKWVNTDDVV